MNKWEDLKIALEREIFLLREILTNMLHEEAALLLGNFEGRKQILHLRAYLLSRLNELRTIRIGAVNAIESEFNKKMDEILSGTTEDFSDILSIGDQLAALLQKLNSQNHRNQQLLRQVGPQYELPFFHYPAQEKKKKKSSIATCPKNEVN